jgi:hypothetical protein
MSPRNLAVLIVFVSALSACGRQIVEFQTDGHAAVDPDARVADGGADGPVATAPTVVSTMPVDGAVGVLRDTTVSATFSRPMNPATLTAVTFTVKQGATAITGAVTVDPSNTVATFTPAAPLGDSLVYTATITTGATDPAGHALAADHVWTFTTGAMVATSPPRVIFTNPANLATNVSITKRPTATFSQAMNPTTITSATFTLSNGATPIAGLVTYDAATNTAMFSPAAPLDLDTVFTGTITTGAKDTGGRALAQSYVWTFTTGACSQGPIDLKSAGGFVVLAGSTVTSTGATSVTGDLGVSPGTAVTGFPPGILVGTQHAGDPTAATAIADLTTAYNDAAGRSLCAVTVAGNLGGMTLAPGLYKSTSSLAISSGNLTLDAQGDGDAVFVFEMASTFTTTSGRQVILTNGAKAANVYWQVGTSATLGTTSVMAGTIMADQAITLETGATLNGRALARIGAVALDTNTIVKPAP